MIDNIIRKFWLNAFKSNKCWQRGLDRGSFDYVGLRSFIYERLKAEECCEYSGKDFWITSRGARERLV